MGNLTIALVFVLILNVFFYFANEAIIDMNPDNNGFFTTEGSMLQGYAKDGNLNDPTLDKDDINPNLPKSESTVEPTTGWNIGDVFSAIGEWLYQKAGGKYIVGIVMSPYNMIGAMNLPPAARFGLGAIWLGVTTWLLIVFVFGRES